MNSQQLLTNLRDVLAGLYLEPASAQRVVADSGLDPRQIAFSPKAADNWYAILTQAVRTQKIDALFDVVLDEFGDSVELLAIYGQYRRFLDQGGELQVLDSFASAQNAPTYTANVSGSGAIAQDKSVAAGAGGIAIGGKQKRSRSNSKLRSD